MKKAELALRSTEEGTVTIAYDFTLKRPGCAIVQAGCSTRRAT